MYPLLKQGHGSHGTSLSYFSHLIDRCLCLRSLGLAKIIHARLIKVGFNSYTFLGNRCLDLYFRFGTADAALKVFDEISDKNTISRNICLKGLFKFGHIAEARSLFDEMPERDVVSWNSMISGCASCGYSDYALNLFIDMQNAGVRPSKFTFSALTSLLLSPCHAKQIHGSMLRRGVIFLNVVLGNSLIDMYGKLGLLDYALGVFLTMERLDIISWNSLISSFCHSSHAELALDQFHLMRSMGYSPDEYTISLVLTACSDLRKLDKGKQVFAFCIKVGFLSNSILSSATIDLFSKCNRLEDSVHLFEEIDQWDSAVCNSMISSYARHGYVEDAIQLFVLSLREDLRPTGFTISSILSSFSIYPLGHGSQVHSLAVKLGFEPDPIVANSLVEMYSKLGLIDYSMRIFVKMDARDLISWNTMIMGLTHNGKVVEALGTFKKLLKEGPPPDRITFSGVLLACKYGGFIEEGITIFSSMEKEHGVTRDDEHYACMVDLLCQAGKLKEAMDIIEAMPCGPSSLIWKPILSASAIYGDLKLTEKIAERMIELEPQSTLPYLLLARMYEMRSSWEGLVRVRKAMRQKRVKRGIGCSSIAIKNHVHTFKADHLQHDRSEEMFSMLGLQIWEIEDEAHYCLLN